MNDNEKVFFREAEEMAKKMGVKVKLPPEPEKKTKKKN